MASGANTVYPSQTGVVDTGFLQNSINSPLRLSSSIAARSTVGFPVAVVIIVSKLTGQQFVIANITYIQTLNTVNYSIPYGEVDFVLPPNVDPPPVGPMDQIYIFMSDQPAGLTTTTTLQFDQNFVALDNRVYSGVVTRMNRTWNRGQGKVFKITFSSNTYRFSITSEYRPNVAATSLDNTPSQLNALSATLSAPLIFSGPVWPGFIVQAAAYQSGVEWRYVYTPVGFDSTLNPNVDASGILATLQQNRSTATYDEGIRIDPKYQISTATGINSFSVFMPTDFNPVTHEYNKWDTLLAQLCETAFCELFCSRFGHLYFRQIAMFLPANTADLVVNPETIVSYEDWEDSSNIITQLEVRVDSGVSGAAFGIYQWAAPNITQLEALYGRRYQKIEAPWAYYTTAEDIVLNPQFAQSQNAIFDYLNAYATIYMARANASNIQGHATILGWPTFEVGSTIYFPHVDLAFYVTTVKHTFEVGGGWVTDVDLISGRPLAADLYNYVSQRAISIGVDLSNINGVNGNQSVTTSSDDGNHAKDSPFNDSFQPIVPRLSPFQGNASSTLTQNWDVNSPNNPNEPVHCGVDLAAASGTGLISVIDGTVVAVSPSSDSEGWGYFVIVQADPQEYSQPFNVCYAHMTFPSSQAVGNKVIKGVSSLGTEGHTGNSTGPHLHFQVQKTGGKFDAIPTNDVTNTADPWKVISPVVSNYTLPTFTTTPTAPSANYGLKYDQSTGYWKDLNYKTDIKTFGDTVQRSIGGQSQFYQALIANETGWLQQMAVPWNVMNLGNTDSNPSGGPKFTDIVSAANAFVALMKTPPYNGFYQYVQSVPIEGFDVSQAANILFKVYNPNHTDSEVGTVTSIYYKNIVVNNIPVFPNV